jgi:hypothetical protein
MKDYWQTCIDEAFEDAGLQALLGFLRGKLADAEKSLRCREEMANPRVISDEEWEEMKKMPGVIVTKGRKLSKAALKEMELAPLRHKRIAAIYRNEVEMFKAVIAALDQPNDQAERQPAEKH